MPGKLERIVFYEASASISVKKKIKGNRSTKRHTTKGRGGTDNTSLWKEVIGMIEDKEIELREKKDTAALLSPAVRLYSASLPASSKKRKHELDINDVAVNTDVSDRQKRLDHEAVRSFIFERSKGDADRLSAMASSFVRDPALQPHLPTEFTRKYTEEQQTAMRFGYNVRDSTQEVTAIGAAATAPETRYKKAAYRAALTGDEAEHRQQRSTTRFLQQHRGKVAGHSLQKRKAQEEGSTVAGLCMPILESSWLSIKRSRAPVAGRWPLLLLFYAQARLCPGPRRAGYVIAINRQKARFPNFLPFAPPPPVVWVGG
jgi:hypothetical protein